MQSKGLFEVLEARRMLSTVSITGTSSADVITVTQSGTTLSVTKNGATTNHANATGLAIGAAGGDDTVTLDSSVTVPATITGGTGVDAITGGSGNDELNGNDGNDQVVGGLGNDLLAGDGGNDSLYGSGGTDTLWNGAGADHFAGENGTDYVDFTDSTSGINADPTTNGMDGASGENDWIFSSTERVTGSAHDDDIFYFSWSYGAGGDDLLFGTINGGDYLSGGDGNDTLQTGAGADTMYGGNDNDFFADMNDGSVDFARGESGSDTKGLSDAFDDVIL